MSSEDYLDQLDPLTDALKAHEKQCAKCEAAHKRLHELYDVVDEDPRSFRPDLIAIADYCEIGEGLEISWYTVLNVGFWTAMSEIGFRPIEESDLEALAADD